MTVWIPDDAWLDNRFATRIQNDLFRGRSSENAPVLALLGAQPGAGKTRGAQFVQSLHGGNLVAVIGDDFRALYPDYKRLQRDNPQDMANITQAVSGPLVKRSIDYAREHRISTLLEGTFRNPNMVCATAADFQAAGFSVHAVALAVPPAVSEVATRGRFWATLGTHQNRWTPPSAHAVAVDNMPATVAALGASTAIDRLTIVDRSGAVLADSHSPGPARAEAMQACITETHIRALTDAEQEVVALTEARIAAVEKAAQVSGVAAAARTTAQQTAPRRGRPGVGR